MSDKRCNGTCDCEYKTFGTWFGCRYHGYCDFQAPRDSRQLGLIDAVAKPMPYSPPLSNKRPTAGGFIWRY